MNTKSHYDEMDDIRSYWDTRYVVWDNKNSEDYKLGLFESKAHWFDERFAKLLPLPAEPSGTVLDYGCGNAMYSPPLLRRFRQYVGVDTSPTALNIAREHFGKQGGYFYVSEASPDCSLMMFPDGTFDCVVSITVLQHQPALLRLKAISEIKRVLKPGGKYVGLEMQGKTLAFDMPPFPEEEWVKAWLPLKIVKDLPPEHPGWWDDNVWCAQ